jgi:hypothetical protein
MTCFPARRRWGGTASLSVHWRAGGRGLNGARFLQLVQNHRLCKYLIMGETYPSALSPDARSSKDGLAG